MRTLKTIHDSETGEPTRIKYTGHNVYVAFAVEAVASSEHGQQYLAVVDCLGTKEIETGDTTAYVDLEELDEAYAAVSQVLFIDSVDTPFAEVNDA